MNTNRCGWLLLALAGLSCSLLVLLVRQQSELNTIRSDIRFARDLVKTIHNYRAVALDGDAYQAANALQMLCKPQVQLPFRNAVADFVDRERRRAVTDIVAYLRTTTGNNYGEDPEKWIDGVKLGRRPK